DEGEVKRVAAELAAKLTPPDAGDFGLEVIDGCGDNSEQSAARIRSAIEALQTLPFFGGKLVWLKNANGLGDSIIGKSIAVQDALEELADVLEAGLAPDVTFLLSATEVDKRRSFYKSLGKRAEVQVIDKLDSSRSGWEEEATEIVRAKAKKRGLLLQEEALDLFVLLTGGDTRQIDNELEKLDLYVGADRSVTAQEVRMLVPLSRAGVIFELGNALAACDLDRALGLVRGLLDQGESAIGILLVAILPTVRNLLLAKDLMERHRLPRPSAPFSFISTLNRLPAEATEHLPRKKDGSFNAYPLGLAAMAAHRFSTDQLIAGLEACLEANLQLVSSQLDHELILTEIVVKLLARKETTR
ncbi:MAG: DNA polymerase III subunit delta, partial [Chthoniobacterales bacterium]